MLDTEHFCIDLYEIFDRIGGIAEPRKYDGDLSDGAYYHLCNILCFTATNPRHFYLFRRSWNQSTGSSRWKLVQTSDGASRLDNEGAQAFTWNDVHKLCTARRAFPELLFYEDSIPTPRQLREIQRLARRLRLRLSPLRHYMLNHQCQSFLSTSPRVKHQSM